MNKQTILTNARLILANEVVHGSLVLTDGKITDVDLSNSSVASAENLEGDYLLPGLIELHTDNQEKYFSPRPGVDWPGEIAIAAHDAQLVSSGITTSFDSVALGDVAGDSTRISKVDNMIKAIVSSQAADINRADHLLHLRCEVSFPKLMEFFDRYIDTPGVQLVSLMDHAPGQRQFPPENIPAYRKYYKEKYGYSDTEVDAFIVEQQANSAKYADKYRRTIAAVCRERGIATASHDDATLAHARESAELGMTVAEFPTTMEAAVASHDLGLKNLMGAPNIIRGGSHSGNMAAHELVEAGCLDILSSDYYPAALLPAAFKVAALDNDYDLAATIALVTRNPAQAVNLQDRGEIAVGKRADLVRVAPVQSGHPPRIVSVWNQAERVY